MEMTHCMVSVPLCLCVSHSEGSKILKKKFNPFLQHNKEDPTNQGDFFTRTTYSAGNLFCPILNHF